MSEDAPVGSVNLEDDEPAAPEAPAPPETAPAPEAEPKAAEVEAVEVGGQQYVPVAAVIAERKQRQALQARAELADQLQAQLNEARPYVEFLRNNPGVMQPRAPEPPAAPAGPEPVDPDVQQLAQVLDLYTGDGKLDLAKAATIRNLVRAEAAAQAQHAVQPWQEQTARTRAEQNKAKVLNITDASGRGPSPESVEQVFRLMPNADAADERVAAVLAVWAMGLDRFKPAAPAPPDTAPALSEPSGGTPRVRVAQSPLEAAVAKGKGIAPSKWAELTSGYQKGRPTVLEED